MSHEVTWNHMASDAAHPEPYPLGSETGATVVGPEAFGDEETLQAVARRAAAKIAAAGREPGVRARVIYVLCGTDWDGLDRVHRLGELIYARLLELPDAAGSACALANHQLSDYVAATRAADDWFRVIGSERGAGVVIVSEIDQPVDYANELSGRVANLVPVDDAERLLERRFRASKESALRKADG